MVACPLLWAPRKHAQMSVNVTTCRNSFKACAVTSGIFTPTVVLSALTGTSYISLTWLSSRLCWEWAWMIWLRVFLLNCFGGRAGGWPSTPSGELKTKTRTKTRSRTSLDHVIINGQQKVKVSDDDESLTSDFLLVKKTTTDQRKK